MNKMSKKGKIEVIFSNEAFQPNHSRVRSIKSKENRVKIRKFDFHYDFRDYLRFSLSKLILRNDTEITYIPQQKVIIGEQTKCLALINKILDEVSRYKLKSVKFNVEHDIDEIEYWLEQGVIVYRPGIIEVALRQLEKKNLFIEECQKFRLTMAEKNIILIKTPREKEKSTTEFIQKMINERTKNNENSIKQQLNSSSDLSMTDNNFNQTVLSKNNQNESTLIQSRDISKQLSEYSSFNITQNDQSLYKEQFNVYYLQKTADNQRSNLRND